MKSLRGRGEEGSLGAVVEVGVCVEVESEHGEVDNSEGDGSGDRRAVRVLRGVRCGGW